MIQIPSFARRFSPSLLLVLSAGCASPHLAEARLPTPDEIGERLGSQALTLEGYDGYTRPVSTANPRAQFWFDQGFQMVYGFSHDAGVWAFGRAAQEDPECAMAWWGIAYGYGVDVNNPLVAEQEAADALTAAQNALRLVESATPVEQALIRAVAKRAVFPIPENRKPLDEAYSTEMKEAWERFPDDPDVGALYAESLMNLQAWDYWTVEGEPLGQAEEIVSVLESILAAHPDHPGANHFYIHTMEASAYPEKAVAAAENLRDMIPGSGHLVHMPSHIFINVGRYEDAVIANQMAIEADEAYFDVVGQPTFYRVYFLHNMHFLAYAAMMEGRSELALSAFKRMEAECPDEMIRMFAPSIDGLIPARLHALIRFGRWEEILEQSQYPEFQHASRATRAFARTVALANLGRTVEARAELARFRELADAIPEDWQVGYNPAANMMDLAGKVAEGEILWRENKPEEALQSLRKAVELEDAMLYTEPPGWMLPVRHALGALLLAHGQAVEAEKVYRVDLEHHPANAWSLLGLEQALRKQGKVAEADTLAPKTAAAWARADVNPPASCYCAASL